MVLDLPWDLEGGINATFMCYPDWFDIDSTNRLSKPNVAREFNKFLSFHTDKTFRNDLFSGLLRGFFIPVMNSSILLPSNSSITPLLSLSMMLAHSRYLAI
jgi:hypothetical protein